MSRAFLLKLTNLATFLAGSFMLGTGLLLAYRLPHGSGSRTVAGLTRHEWGDVHLWIGLTLAALVAVHLLEHRTWLLRAAASGKPWRLAAGLALGAILAAAPILAPVEPEGDARQRDATHPSASNRH